MTQQELDIMLAKHDQWMKTGCAKGSRLIVQKEDLSGLDFSYRNLTGAILCKCKLDGANFNYSVFSGADFSGSSMKACRLASAHVYSSNFDYTDLADAWLELSIWEASSLSQVRAPNLHAQYASFSYCTFTNSISCNSIFRDSRIIGTDIRKSIFDGTTFEDSTLSGIDLSDTSFNYTNFEGAKFDYCVMPCEQPASWKMKNTSFIKCKERDIPKKTIVICAYPNCGKTYASDTFQNYYSIVEISNSKFGELPVDYIQTIKGNMGKVDFIFVSTHKAVRRALREAGIPYVLVCPKPELENAWTLRELYKDGNTGYIQQDWDKLMFAIDQGEDSRTEVHWLDKQDYISLSLLESLL